ncbi:hypothetical protein FSP39_014377 [Pinctada imbricata]|uniref:DUF1907 domain-containing protein n=1 Tax=Pinctada imbricata TaxID=66713 RepID=A0AA88XNJ3_PINIB|nr:hypothetical protein FSP39_014377 [Pinctada imbricata]
MILPKNVFFQREINVSENYRGEPRRDLEVVCYAMRSILSGGLQNTFSDVSVNIVECPDLTQDPFMLTSPGLGGSPRLADIGGPAYLIPLPQKDKRYSFQQIAKAVELPNAFMIGAGAGPHHIVGVNSELMNNVKLNEKAEIEKNNAHIAKVNQENGRCILEKLNSNEFCLMGNFLCCEGKPGKVIEVKAKKRHGEENFMSSMRKTLYNHYGNKSVALGGVFLVERGKANLHIMPDFSKTPLTSQEDTNKWLRFYEMNAPLICVGELVSHDPDLDLRIEHFHCFSKHGQGGHYHFDVTPNDVEYRGYFTVAEYIYRIDKPPVITQIGR